MERPRWNRYGEPALGRNLGWFWLGFVPGGKSAVESGESGEYRNCSEYWRLGKFGHWRHRSVGRRIDSRSAASSGPGGRTSSGGRRSSDGARACHDRGTASAASTDVPIDKWGAGVGAGVVEVNAGASGRAIINSSSRAPHPCCARVPAQASRPCVPSAPSDRVLVQPVPSSFPRASRHGLSIDGAMPARMEGRANLRIPVQTRGRCLGERRRLRLRARRLPALRAMLRASAMSSVATLVALGTWATWAARI